VCVWWDNGVWLSNDDTNQENIVKINISWDENKVMIDIFFWPNKVMIDD